MAGTGGRGGKSGESWSTAEVLRLNEIRKLVAPLLLFALLLFASSAHAQTRFTSGVTMENDQGLGFSFPVVAMVAGVEQPIGSRWELDGFGGYAIARKAAVHSGHELSAGGTVILWVTPWLGVTAGDSYTQLWTSDYSKGGWRYGPGLVFRAYPLRLPSRLWLSGVVPSGKIDANGIESNRLSGGAFTWETLFGSAGPFSIRLALSVGVYHGYDQGNPQCDGTWGGPVTCPRRAGLLAMWASA